MKALRKAVYDLLNNQITYKSATINIYDEKVFTGQEPKVYILLSTQQESPGDQANDCTFMVRSSIDIEIITKAGSEVSKDAMDDISSDIMELLNPTPGVAGFTISGWQISYFEVSSALTRTLEISPTESILRKIITFTAQLIQQS